MLAKLWRGGSRRKRKEVINGSEGELDAEGEREGPGRIGGGGDAGDGVDLRERETEDHAGLKEDADTEDPVELKLDAERRRETQRQRLRARESEREREREEEAIGGASQHMREDMVLNERGASNVSEGESIEGGASGTGCANVEASGPWQGLLASASVCVCIDLCLFVSLSLCACLSL